MPVYRSDNRFITHSGRRQTVAQWARDVGLSPRLLRYRLSAGWPVADALAPPRAYTKRAKSC